ncbi:Type II secretion system protein K [Sphingomonas sp. EC-HK361]|jgi:general secretion pathway protein K|uniref:type II secretion system minor pseudopilin GspK n=1 Tax=Sphingomonas sp. EC-HK361 TaxID=2038397 RepID=UPI0012576169|nr:type II secretion system minor pseudopilin GspK [Sphingomonas sp. EC-HK361]VVT02572.1 Type II secretion system protein K [Sphingomonas sp. EC-HK361]
MHPRREHPQSERGAALLTVLLLVAIISVVAATTLEKLRVSTRLATNAGAISQGRSLAMAAETLAVTKVTDLLGRDPSRVTLAGGWSDRPYVLPLPGGTATARVHDGGNCFNLNSLVTKQNDLYVANPAMVTQFARLLRLVGVNANGQAIAAATADWIDSDDSVLPGGAEDGAYAGLDPGYRTAGTLMADATELRAVAGVSPEVYAAVRPWICALPQARPSTLNVNTMTPEQAPLFAMLFPDTMGVEGARAILLRRPPQGWDSAANFWTAPALAGKSPGDAQAQADVTSRWFALRIDVRFGGSDLEEHGLIDATALPAQLVRRQWGEDL